MQTVADRPEAPTAIRTDLGAIFVSLELSRSTWLITSLSPGGGEKMSKQVVRGGDVAELLERFARLREKARARTGKVFPFVVIQEAGLDGFWIDRALQNEGIESHVVDPASIATSRRRRRAKTDGIDGEAWFARCWHTQQIIVDPLHQLPLGTVRVKRLQLVSSASSTSFTIVRIVRSGCVAGTRASMST